MTLPLLYLVSTAVATETCRHGNRFRCCKAALEMCARVIVCVSLTCCSHKLLIFTSEVFCPATQQLLLSGRSSTGCFWLSGCHRSGVLGSWFLVSESEENRGRARKSLMFCCQKAFYHLKVFYGRLAAGAAMSFDTYSRHLVILRYFLLSRSNIDWTNQL